MSFYGYTPIPNDYSYVARAGEGFGKAAGAAVGAIGEVSAMRRVNKAIDDAQAKLATDFQFDLGMEPVTDANGNTRDPAQLAAERFIYRQPGLSSDKAAEMLAKQQDIANKWLMEEKTKRAQNTNFGNTAELLAQGRTQTRPVEADVSDKGFGLSMPQDVPTNQRLFGVGGGATPENAPPSYLADSARKLGVPKFADTDDTRNLPPAVGNTAEQRPSLMLGRPPKSLMLPESFEPPKDEKKPQTVTEAVPYTNAEKVHEWVKAFGTGKINKDQLAAAVLGMDWEKKDADDKAKALETVIKAITDKQKQEDLFKHQKELAGINNAARAEQGELNRKSREGIAAKRAGAEKSDSKPDWNTATGRQAALMSTYNSLIKEFLAEYAKLSSYDQQVKKGAESRIAQYPDKIYAAQKAYNGFLDSMRDDFPKREKNIGEYLPIPKNIEDKLNKVINANKGPGN